VCGAAWFLDKVIVTNENTGQQWFFLSGKWLAKDEEDGAIECEIPSVNEDGVYVDCGWVFFNNILGKCTYYLVQGLGYNWRYRYRRGAGTDANVFMTIFGSDGESGERKLESSGNNFAHNQTDAFSIVSVDLGDIQRSLILQI